MAKTAMDNPAASHMLHATCVAIGGRGVLIIGPSGAGKSDLALRLIDRGAKLVSDDYCVLIADGGRLLAAPPSNIAGTIEVRHLGILDLEHVANVPVAMAVRLEEKPERMPEDAASIELLGLPVPLVALAGLEASAPIKLELALARIVGSGPAA